MTKRFQVYLLIELSMPKRYNSISTLHYLTPQTVMVVYSIAIIDVYIYTKFYGKYAHDQMILCVSVD